MLFLIAFRIWPLKCIWSPCADPENFVRGGPTSDIFFDGGQRIQLTLKAGHHRPTSETPFKWGFAGGPMMALH